MNTATITVELQRLMNAATEHDGRYQHAIIGAHKVSCTTLPVGNTTKRQFRFMLDDKRAAFKKVCDATVRAV
jgi:hypothetical protein